MLQKLQKQMPDVISNLFQEVVRMHGLQLVANAAGEGLFAIPTVLWSGLISVCMKENVQFGEVD